MNAKTQTFKEYIAKHEIVVKESRSFSRAELDSSEVDEQFVSKFGMALAADELGAVGAMMRGPSPAKSPRGSARLKAQKT